MFQTRSPSHKEMRDWRRSSRRPGSARTAKDKTASEAEFLKLFEGESHGLATIGKEEQVANALSVKALDHALRQGCGRPMSGCMPQTALAPLTGMEVRYFVAVGELPPECHRDGVVRRSCVHDQGSGATRLEVPAGILCEPSDATKGPPLGSGTRVYSPMLRPL